MLFRCVASRPDAAADTQNTPPATPGSMLQLGTVHNGKFALYENAIHDLPQGTMVFIISNDNNK
ncbi:MAG: hypothetical protein ACTHN5_05430 [Phycisphaerae bacterium]